MEFVMEVLNEKSTTKAFTTEEGPQTKISSFLYVMLARSFSETDVSIVHDWIRLIRSPTEVVLVLCLILLSSFFFFLVNLLTFSYTQESDPATSSIEYLCTTAGMSWKLDLCHLLCRSVVNLVLGH